VREVEAVGRRALALQLDVARPHGFTLDAALPHFGRDSFDFLVNNGGFSRGGSIADVTEEDIDALVDVHFKGPLLLTQALLPRLADGGAIVNLSTGLARFTAPERAVYGSVKGAVEVLTRYLAAELGPRGITANVIAPGPVATDFSDGVIRDTPAFQQHLASITPLGRVAGPDDIGAAIANLLRPGNAWVTGQRIEVSGGIHL
jgi:NAD(P)-dependent dehydrogenase (short-subunit alcohol dehydrogenase family)